MTNGNYLHEPTEITELTQVQPSPTPGTYSNQQVQTSIENLGNRTRKGGSDDEYKNPTIHSLDTTTKQTKNNTAPPGEYTKPVTMTIPPGNTPASGGEDETLLTASETRTAQTLDAIPAEPIKRTGEDADQFAEPITTTAPKKRQSGPRIAHGN